MRLLAGPHSATSGALAAGVAGRPLSLAVYDKPIERALFVDLLCVREDLRGRGFTPILLREFKRRNLASFAGDGGGYYQGGSAYSAAKAGVHGFIRDVALELAEHGINVNAVAPGPSTPSGWARACGGSTRPSSTAPIA